MAEGVYLFENAFEALTGHRPFPWQTELYFRLLRGSVPSVCDIPTGLGKTAVVAVWLIALARCPDKLPRRLVYVVNRRTVVDQTSAEVERLRERLEQAGLSDHLRQLCAVPLPDGEPPFAISTLRGQFADNRQWSADPARPAAIVGTVDMIGSRLLFGGYGVGFKTRPLHAGFLAQDVLLVHDEAHLEPAFQKQLIEIMKEQERCQEFRRLRVMELTATRRAPQLANQEDVLALSEQERTAPGELPAPPTQPLAHLWRRINAAKKLSLLAIEDEKTDLVANKITEVALTFADSARAILVFAHSVDTVEKIVEQLRKKGQLVQQLTGTLRGLERDELPHDPVFVRFLPESERPENVDVKQGTVYLICTSAGEVGVNISADHLVCDLTTFESMAQRFGRVNRFGNCSDTKIHVVHPQRFDGDDPYQKARQKTLDLLGQLNGDASPAALGRLDASARAEAFSPEPAFLPATDVILDCWALTTVRDTLPGRPSLEAYLHGIRPGEPPETYLAWRQEVEVLRNEELREIYPPEDLLEDYPLKPHEVLRDRSDRVFKHLAAIAERHPQEPVWLVDDTGSVAVLTLGELIDRANKDRINYRTVLLPPSVGGLANGLLDGKSENATDVADEWYHDRQKTARCRVRVWDDEPVPTGMRLIRTVDTRPDADEHDGEALPRRFWYWYELARVGDTEGSQAATTAVKLEDHTQQVVAIARSLADKLALPNDLKEAVVLAAKYHDLGKDRPLWQRSIGNTDPSCPLAKSGNRLPPVELTNYRHEFGSLLDVQDQPEFSQLSADKKDLLLHLIAAHHGRARPHFPADEAFDPKRPQTEAETNAAEVPRRFARLQRRYGRWGLAYLESLLRAADRAASAGLWAPSAPALLHEPKQSSAQGNGIP